MLLCVGFPFAMPAGPCRAAYLDMHQRTACIRARCENDAAAVSVDNSRHILYSSSDKFSDSFHLLFYVDYTWMMRHHLLGIVLDKSSIFEYHFNFYLPFYSTAAERVAEQ